MTTGIILFYATNTGSSQVIIHGSPGLSNIELAMNEKTGQLWTPAASPSENVLAGGAPFSLGGVVNSLKLRGYSEITEQVPIQITGATEDAILDTLSTLRNALNSTQLRAPGVLSFRANNVTNITFYLILGGDVQESPSFINEEAGRLKMRAVITWVRGSTGLDADSDTLQNAQTITNNANASPPNYKIMSGMDGDFLYAGQPITWNITPATNGMFKGTGVQRAYIATLFEAPTYINTNDAISTTSTSGVTIATENTTLSLIEPAFGVKHRVMARITSPTSNLEIRIRVVFGNGTVGSGAAIYTSKWIAPGTNTTIVDFGMFRLPFDRIAFSSSTAVRIITEARSTNGASATGTWADMEILDYKTFARVTSTVSLTDVVLSVRGASSYNALPVSTVNVPYTFPQVQFLAGSISGAVMDFPEVVGMLPTGLENLYFWVVTLTGGVHDPTDTGTLTITSARLWQTMRGS